MARGDGEIALRFLCVGGIEERVGVGACVRIRKAVAQVDRDAPIVRIPHQRLRVRAGEAANAPLAEIDAHVRPY
jgi:hypothetical protein